MSDPGATTATATDSGSRGAAILHEITRNAAGSTGLVALATSSALPAAIVSAIVSVQYLNPSQFGEYALLMVYATFLTVLYNVGLLHGTFLWVYGYSGESGDDLEIEGMGRAGVNSQRRAMTTGLIMLLIVAGVGTTLFFIFKRPLAILLLGDPHAANLIGWAAISGAAGSMYRLTCNVFRFERRQVAFSVAMVVRPVSIVVVTVVMLVAGYGLWGAVIGTVIPTVACAAGCMLATARSYALAFSLHDVKEIVVRGGAVVIPVVALFILHNGDIYVVSHFVHGSAVGVYRLASRLGTPPSYLASAFIMTWSPLERSPLGTAAFESEGRLEFRAGVATYYILVGLAMVVLFVMFAHLFVLVAPRSYANAANIVPLIALSYVAYGAYIVLLRTARPHRMIMWYTITAVMAAVVFLLAAAVLIPAVGVSGTPIALTVAMVTGCSVVLIVNRRNPEPMPFPFRRVAAGLAVSGGVSAATLLGARAGQPTAAAITVACLIAYFPLLVVAGAVPRSHVATIRDIVLTRSAQVQIVVPAAELPAAERGALETFERGELTGRRPPMEYARLVRALRRMAAIGRPGDCDVGIGRYLASREPEAIRDFQASALIADGVDPYELHRLDRLAKTARRSPLTRATPPAHSGSTIRRRARLLDAQERRALVSALAAAAPMPGAGPSGAPSPSGRLALVRAVRRMRGSLGLGAPSPRDLALARALWQRGDADLDSHDRHELRLLRAAVKSTQQLELPSGETPGEPGAHGLAFAGD